MKLDTYIDWVDHARVSSAHDVPFRPEYSKNKYILKWWTPAHDEMLLSCIEKKHWVWHHRIFDQIIKITPPEVIKQWQDSDPICKQYAWYNILWNFAAARADELGLTKNMREPKWRVCPFCNNKFREDSVRFTFVRRLGIDQIDICQPCLAGHVFMTTGRNVSKEEVISYLQELTEVLQRVPPQDYGDGETDLWQMSTEERVAFLRITSRKPPRGVVKALFGSWLHALIEAGVLEDGTRRTSRGTQCVAKDGHVCLSLGEKTIDDFLFASGIAHQKEPLYPEGNMRADFEAQGVFIEYFGLAGDPDYDARIKLKINLCKKHKIALVALYATDLNSPSSMKKKLMKYLAM